MKYFYDNVFIKKDNWDYDDFINGLYWLLLISKNIFKWIYAATLFSEDNYMLLILLSLNPLLRFVLIGVGNIHNFRKKFRNNAIVAIIFFISKPL